MKALCRSPHGRITGHPFSGSHAASLLACFLPFAFSFQSSPCGARADALAPGIHSFGRGATGEGRSPQDGLVSGVRQRLDVASRNADHHPHPPTALRPRLDDASRCARQGTRPLRPRAWQVVRSARHPGSPSGMVGEKAAGHRVRQTPLPAPSTGMATSIRFTVPDQVEAEQPEEPQLHPLGNVA